MYIIYMYLNICDEHCLPPVLPGSTMSTSTAKQNQLIFSKIQVEIY